MRRLNVMIRRRWSVGVATLAVAVLGAACVPVTPPPPPPPPVPPAPTAFEAIAPPTGATAAPSGTAEWYWAPAPGGRAVTLGVYRPVSPLPNAATILILSGADGFRRVYEDLAARYAAAGHVAVVGCWYDHDAVGRMPDAIDCVRGPTWKGMNASAVDDVDALVEATRQVPGTDPGRIVLHGHSYGAGVALLRAAEGATEPAIGSSGLYAPTPPGDAVPLPGDEYPIDDVATITVPVLLVHAEVDNITVLGQAQAMEAALSLAGNPPTFAWYPAPARHDLPWGTELLPEDPYPPNTEVRAQFLATVLDWLAERLP
jgi:dienelactone hydrolase